MDPVRKGRGTFEPSSGLNFRTASSTFRDTYTQYGRLQIESDNKATYIGQYPVPFLLPAQEYMLIEVILGLTLGSPGVYPLSDDVRLTWRLHSWGGGCSEEITLYSLQPLISSCMAQFSSTFRSNMMRVTTGVTSAFGSESSGKYKDNSRSDQIMGRYTPIIVDSAVDIDFIEPSKIAWNHCNISGSRLLFFMDTSYTISIASLYLIYASLPKWAVGSLEVRSSASESDNAEEHLRERLKYSEQSANSRVDEDISLKNNLNERKSEGMSISSLRIRLEGSVYNKKKRGDSLCLFKDGFYQLVCTEGSIQLLCRALALSISSIMEDASRRSFQLTLVEV